MGKSAKAQAAAPPGSTCTMHCSPAVICWSATGATIWPRGSPFAADNWMRFASASATLPVRCSGQTIWVRSRGATSRWVGSGHLKGAVDDGRTRLWAIGFQWADRVPWLGDELVDAAFRIECDEYN